MPFSELCETHSPWATVISLLLHDVPCIYLQWPLRNTCANYAGFPGLGDTHQSILYKLRATQEQQFLQYRMPILQGTVRLAGMDQRRVHGADRLLTILLNWFMMDWRDPCFREDVPGLPCLEFEGGGLARDNLHWPVSWMSQSSGVDCEPVRRLVKPAL